MQTDFNGGVDLNDLMPYKVGDWVISDIVAEHGDLPWGRVWEVLGYTPVDGNWVYTLKGSDGKIAHAMGYNFRKVTPKDMWFEEEFGGLIESKDSKVGEKSMKFKIGDKVRIKKDLVVDKEAYAMEHDSNIDAFFVYEMDEEPKEDRVITDYENGRYKLDGSRFYFTDGMLEAVTESPESPEVDMVNHPPHYQIGGIESLDVIRMSMSKKQFKGYLKGQVLKYRERAQFKGNPEQDYAKAKFYYDLLMELKAEKKSKKRRKK